MNKNNFLNTDVGKLALAGLLVLSSFVVIYSAITFSINELYYVGLLMIVVGMAVSPIIAFMSSISKDKKEL